MDRIMGVITLKAPVYKDIASDPNATPQARNVVIIVAILSAIFGGAVPVIQGSGLIAGIVGALLALAFVLIAWYVNAWALAFVAKSFFKGQTETQNMLRVTGFTSVFQVVTYVLRIIPCLGFVGTILQIIGNIIGIREAGGLTTMKAVLTAIIAGVLVAIIYAIFGTIALLFGA
jgi:hypothetical protein